jgi:ferritin-like metal-binding protein YciE
MKTLQRLFIEELADVYDSENRLAKALPKMVRAVTDPELRLTFQSEIRETESQKKMLEKVFATVGERPKARRCNGIVGLLKEGHEVTRRNKGEPTINAALISVGQKAKHYEIAAYGCLIEWARLLGNQEAVQLLGGILDDEKAADKKLTQLARSLCNHTANEGFAVGYKNPNAGHYAN